MKFSVVIPAYNAAATIEACLRSCAFEPDTEVIVSVESNCTDDTFYTVREWALDNKPPALTYMMERWPNIEREHQPHGPGVMRNAALNVAKGDWIVFLDADDQLAPCALTTLKFFIQDHPDVDAIGYDWAWSHAPTVKQRNDGKYLALPKQELLKEYLTLHMDGSVIFTAIRNGPLRFFNGLHEDVPFLFNVYQLAYKVAYLPKIIYYKTDRSGSIVRTITEAHIDGFIHAWEEVGLHVGGTSMQPYYEIGTIGVIATRVREIYRKAENKNLLYQYFFNSLPTNWKRICAESTLDTQYAKIAKLFAVGNSMSISAVDPSLFNKTWSCVDLQGSLFLAPDEVRTCCKRFFVDGEMKGDMKLVNAAHVSVENILAAKQELIDGINKGEPTPCSGCPFMEFKEWEPVAPLRIKYLSLEHHSVCNMRCSYCSDEYYGGKQAEYDVGGLIVDLLADDALEGCRTIVWGGGEPTVGKDFERLATALKTALPMVKQRILTNALKWSPVVQRMLDEDRVTIVTSIDAGTQETFTKVRGMGKLSKVLENLQKYALHNPQAVTIKYILTEDNASLDEVKAYVKLLEQYGLTGCNFQISCDFKQEVATELQALAATGMHFMLRKIGCKVIFFDDLLMQRLVECDTTGVVGIEAPYDYPDGIVLFGTGAMTEWMLKHSMFLTHVRIVKPSEGCYIPGLPVLITGSQSYPETYRRALAMGVPEEMIIRGVVL